MTIEKLTRYLTWKNPSETKYTYAINEGKEDFDKLVTAFQNSTQKDILNQTTPSGSFCTYFQNIIENVVTKSTKEYSNKEEEIEKAVIAKLERINGLNLKKVNSKRANEYALWALSFFQNYCQYLETNIADIDKNELGKRLTWIKFHKSSIGNLFGVPLDKRSMAYFRDDSSLPISFASMFRLLFGITALFGIWASYSFYTHYPTESSENIMKKIQILQEIIAEDKEAFEPSSAEITHNMHLLHQYQDKLHIIKLYESGVLLILTCLYSLMLIAMGIPLAADKYVRSSVPREVNQISKEIDKMIDDLDKQIHSPSLDKVKIG